VFRHLQNKEMVSELFGEVAERVGDRPGGYTRIIKLGQRSGDGAELALVELVDYNDVKPAGSSSGGGGGTRRGSGKGRRSDAGSTQTAETPADTETDEAETEPAETDAADEPASEAEQPEVEQPEGEADAASDEAAGEADDEPTDKQ
jgi:large subunit ribosomal protein L17